VQPKIEFRESRPTTVRLKQPRS